MNDRSRIIVYWLSLSVSCAALVLVFQQADFAKTLLILKQLDYVLIVVAMVLQLVVTLVIALRWSLLFSEVPRLKNLIRGLFVAQLVNFIMPIRVGALVRIYIVARREHFSKLMVLTTVISEKIFDSLAFFILFFTVTPIFAPQWFQISSLGVTSILLALLFPLFLLISHKRKQIVNLFEGLNQKFSWIQYSKAIESLSKGLKLLQQIRDVENITRLCCATVAISFLGCLVNYALLRAFDIEVPFTAAVLLLLTLQIGVRLLPTAPLGGIGIFQLICIETLAFFSVDRDVAISYSLILQLVIFVPGSVLGWFFVHNMRYSLTRLKAEAEDLK